MDKYIPFYSDFSIRVQDNDEGFGKADQEKMIFFY